MAYLHSVIESFLAQLQRRGLRPERLEHLRLVINAEVDAAHRAGTLVVPEPVLDAAITKDDSPRAITSRRMPAVRLPPPPLPPDDDDDKDR